MEIKLDGELRKDGDLVEIRDWVKIGLELTKNKTGVEKQVNEVKLRRNFTLERDGTKRYEERTCKLMIWNTDKTIRRET